MELRLEVLKFRPGTLEAVVSITKLEEFRLSMVGSAQRVNTLYSGGPKSTINASNLSVKSPQKELTHP